MFSCQVMSDSLQPHGLQHTRPPCPSPFLGVCPSLCPLNWWCHPTISSSVTLFCLPSFPASGSFPVSWLFALGGQQIGASASTSVFPVSSQGWFPLRLTGLSLGSMHEAGCSRLVHWDDPERWDGEGGRREGQNGEHMYTHGWFMWMYGKNHHNIVK